MNRRYRILVAVFCISLLLSLAGGVTALAAGKEGSSASKRGSSLPEVTGVQIKDRGTGKQTKEDPEPKTGEEAPFLLFAGVAATGVYLFLSLRERAAEN